MKIHLLFLFIFGLTISVNAQNKHKLQTNFWDFEKTKPMSRGFFYADDFTGETTLKHGKWSYWNRDGLLVEVRNYIKGDLNGEVLAYYNNGKMKEKGYFKMGVQDSVFSAWYDNGKIQATGKFKNGEPVDLWTTYYFTG